ncbi:MAG: hypothetical protein ABI855_07510 [Bacteroidota bacterium]
MKTLTKNDIQNKKDRLTEEQENSFVSKSDIKILLLEPGDILGRMISQKNRPKFSPFWMDEKTMSDIFSVIRSSEDYSEANKKNIIRNSGAILKEWSNLSWRIKIALKKPVIAYHGKIGTQKNFDNDLKITGAFGTMVQAKEHRLGGFEQYVIPSFYRINDEEGETFAEIKHFAHL